MQMSDTQKLGHWPLALPSLKAPTISCFPMQYFLLSFALSKQVVTIFKYLILETPKI